MCEVRSAKPALLPQAGVSSTRHWSRPRNKVHRLAPLSRYLRNFFRLKPDEASGCLVTVIEVRFCQHSKKPQQNKTLTQNPRRRVCQENCAVFARLLFSLGFEVVWAGESRLHRSRVYPGISKAGTNTDANRSDAVTSTVKLSLILSPPYRPP